MPETDRVAILHLVRKSDPEALLGTRDSSSPCLDLGVGLFSLPPVKTTIPRTCKSDLAVEVEAFGDKALISRAELLDGTTDGIPESIDVFEQRGTVWLSPKTLV